MCPRHGPRLRHRPPRNYFFPACARFAELNIAAITNAREACFFSSSQIGETKNRLRPCAAADGAPARKDRFDERAPTPLIQSASLGSDLLDQSTPVSAKLWNRAPWPERVPFFLPSLPQKKKKKTKKEHRRKRKKKKIAIFTDASAPPRAPPAHAPTTNSRRRGVCFATYAMPKLFWATPRKAGSRRSGPNRNPGRGVLWKDMGGWVNCAARARRPPCQLERAGARPAPSN